LARFVARCYLSAQPRGVAAVYVGLRRSVASFRSECVNPDQWERRPEIVDAVTSNVDLTIIHEFVRRNRSLGTSEWTVMG
jgi:hypothetical protein